ncbi:MAG TPA: Mur ligase family protein, partial [Candidatus Polarisedimenticolia bacterium]|nr:Mur ligase family protein [Candidatus Polarisedimenticolia bacterium]
MDYRATLTYLDEIQGRGIKLGLDTMIRLLAAMADPHKAYPSVVVAGTNGKGSVCAMLDSILRECGLRTGRYTSPHLVRYEERIAVNGAPVTQSEFAAAVTTVSDHIGALTDKGALEVHPTHFEVLTAAAMHHFRQQGIDAGVLEVGMGGRLDAVAVARTTVAVITNVRLDHTKHLGRTEEAIAVQKAGVIREGCLAITGESRPGPLKVIRDEARARGVRLIEKDHEARVAISEGDAPVRFALTTSRAVYPDLVVPFTGRHQIDNAVLAVLAAEAFRAPGPLSAEA